MDKIGVRIGLNMVFAVPRLPSVMALVGEAVRKPQIITPESYNLKV